MSLWSQITTSNVLSDKMVCSGECRDAGSTPAEWKWACCCNYQLLPAECHVTSRVVTPFKRIYETKKHIYAASGGPRYIRSCNTRHDLAALVIHSLKDAYCVRFPILSSKDANTFECMAVVA
jgi:hypothetical protein